MRRAGRANRHGARRRTTHDFAAHRRRKIVDADPGLRSAQALRRHDEDDAVRASVFRTPGISLWYLNSDSVSASKQSPPGELGRLVRRELLAQVKLGRRCIPHNDRMTTRWSRRANPLSSDPAWRPYPRIGANCVASGNHRRGPTGRRAGTTPVRDPSARPGRSTKCQVHPISGRNHPASSASYLLLSQIAPSLRTSMAAIGRDYEYGSFNQRLTGRGDHRDDNTAGARAARRAAGLACCGGSQVVAGATCAGHETGAGVGGRGTKRRGVSR